LLHHVFSAPNGTAQNSRENITDLAERKPKSAHFSQACNNYVFQMWNGSQKFGPSAFSMQALREESIKKNGVAF